MYVMHTWKVYAWDVYICIKVKEWKSHGYAMNAWNGIMHNERYACMACIGGTRMRYEQMYVDDMYAWNNIWLWM